MPRKILLSLATFYLLLLSACVPLGTLQISLETPTPDKVEMPSDLEASPTNQPTPEIIVTEESVPVATTGIVSGRLCYPSEFVPAMTIYFQQTPGGDLKHFATVENQNTYTIELSPGTYRAFAWVDDFQLGGAYTSYVACGFAETCTDHGLQSFDVQAGQSLTNIDLCDWPFPADQLPLPIPTLNNDPNLEGMIYSTQEGAHFRIGANGSLTNLYSGPGMVISPDGTHGLYALENDLFVLNLTTGEQINLTNTPNAPEMLFQWPFLETIFFTILPGEDFVGPGMTGGLYTIHPDGTGFTALDPETNTGGFAVSPDGQFVAYGAGPEASVMDLQTGQTYAFPSDFGMTCPGSCSLSSPAWSPDGQTLAWWAQGDFNGQGAFAVTAFDLNAKTVEIIHPYQIVGRGGYLPAPKFSPDGKWIAFEAYDQDFSRNGLWLASVGAPNQSTEFFLGSFAYNPSWNSDGRWLAYTQYVEAEQVQRIFLYDLPNSLILQATALPENVTVLDW